MSIAIDNRRADALLNAGRMQDFGRYSLAAGLVILGITGLTAGDFAMQWQPVPEAMLGRAALAYAIALIEVGVGACLMLRNLRQPATLGASVLLMAWVLLLHLPHVAAEPSNLLNWLGFAEISSIAIGAAIAANPNRAATAPWPVVARLLFGVMLLIFGSTHFVFSAFTARMIPGWLPVPLFWAYLTGAGHIGAGLALLSGLVIRTATTVFALMISSIVLLLHVPRVAAMPDNRAEWTMLAIALCIQAAAWTMAAQSARGKVPVAG